MAVSWGNLHQLSPQEELFNSAGRDNKVAIMPRWVDEEVRNDVFVVGFTESDQLNEG